MYVYIYIYKQLQDLQLHLKLLRATTVEVYVQTTNVNLAFQQCRGGMFSQDWVKDVLNPWSMSASPSHMHMGACTHIH